MKSEAITQITKASKLFDHPLTTALGSYYIFHKKQLQVAFAPRQTLTTKKKKSSNRSNIIKNKSFILIDQSFNQFFIHSLINFPFLHIIYN